MEVVEVDALSLEAADILKLELLLGARCGEISGLPPRRSIATSGFGRCLPSRWKNGRQRVTPIVGLARKVLDQRLTGVEKGPLFLREKGVVVSSAHIGHYLLTRRTTLPIAVFTSHDLRRTFATMLAEMGIALDLVAAIVGHESGGKDTRPLVHHYVHSDMLQRKARALQVWDQRLRAIVTGKERTKVVPLPQAGSGRFTDTLCLSPLHCFSRRRSALPRQQELDSNSRKSLDIALFCDRSPTQARSPFRSSGCPPSF